MKALSKEEIQKLPIEHLDEIYEAMLQMERITPKDWIPHTKQKLFHCFNTKGRILLGGNRSGKTEAGAVEAVMHATGIYPTWYPQEQRIKQPNKGRIIVSDFAKGFGETLKPKLDKWLPQDMIKSTRKGHSGFIEKYELINGSTIDICTHEQENNIFEGWSGHWAWFDEPPPRSKFIATLRGLIDYSGRYWITATPLSEAWVHDELVNRKDGSVSYIEVDIRDNPHISEKEIKDFEGSLTEEEKDARLHGKFMHLSGVVYKNIDQNVHYRKLDLSDKDSKFYEMKKTWFFVLDPHDRREHCGVWFFINPLQKKYAAYELQKGGTIQEVSSYILQFEKENKIPSNRVMRIGDPNKMETPNAINGYKLKQEFAKYGLYFRTNIDDDITKGHIAVREQFSWNSKKELDPINSPSLYFSENVPNCKKMFNMYSFLEWRGRTQDYKNPRETPQDKNKDFPDCFRYFIMSNPRYIAEKEFEPVSNYKTTSRTGYR